MWRAILSHISNQKGLKGWVQGLGFSCHYRVLSYRMGLLSSKRQVSGEKGKGWSPVKVHAQSKAPPPLPPLVSDQPLQGESLRYEVLPEPVLMVSR